MTVVTPSALRLALVADSFDSLGTGEQRLTVQIAEDLSRRGHSVTVLTGYASSDLASNGVDVEAFCHTPATHWMHQLIFARWAARRMAIGDFDTSLSMTTMVPAAVLQPSDGIVHEAQRRSIQGQCEPWKRLFHSITVGLSPSQWLRRQLEVRTLMSSDLHRLVVTSQYVADQAERIRNFDTEKLQIIVSTAQLDTVSEQETRQFRRSLRRALRIDEKSIVFLFSACDPFGNGARPLLKAVQQLNSRGMDLTLLICDCHQYRLNRLAAELGIRRQIRWMGKTPQRSAIYATADVTVLPSYYDPSGLVVVESLLAGVPVITSAFNGAAELLIDADTDARGRVVQDPDDVDALAAAMADLINPGVRAVCHRSIKQIQSQLTMGRFVDELEIILKESAAE